MGLFSLVYLRVIGLGILNWAAAPDKLTWTQLTKQIPSAVQPASQCRYFNYTKYISKNIRQDFLQISLGADWWERQAPMVMQRVPLFPSKKCSVRPRAGQSDTSCHVVSQFPMKICIFFLLITKISPTLLVLAGKEETTDGFLLLNYCHNILQWKIFHISNIFLYKYLFNGHLQSVLIELKY